MALEGWFGIPAFINDSEGEELENIQQEFDEVVKDLQNKDSFKKVESWDPGTMKLSDNEFSSSLFDNYDLPCFKKLLEKNLYRYLYEVGAPLDKVEKYRVTRSWITNTTKNEYAHPHTHSSVDMAGVYYYQTNQKDGNIYFKSPNPLTTRYCFEHFPTELEVTPKVGRMIIFPGWLEHGVFANRTNHERISCSFNIIFPRQ